MGIQFPRKSSRKSSLRRMWAGMRRVREERIDSRHEAWDSTYLNFSPQDDVCITRIS